MPEIINIRASSMADLFDCPHRWEAINIKKMYLPKNEKAHLGTSFHAGTAVYDSSTMEINGASEEHSPTISIDDAKGVIVDSIYHPKEEIVWEELNQKEAEKILLPLFEKYAVQITPTMNFAGIEVTAENITISDLALSISGTLDRLYFDEFGQLGIADIKTGSTAVKADGEVSTAKHVAQVGIYEILATHAVKAEINAPALIIGANTGKTEKAQRVGKGQIHNAKELILGNEFQKGILSYASKMLHSGMFYGNPKSQICGEKYCPIYNNCFFRK